MNVILNKYIKIKNNKKKQKKRKKKPINKQTYKVGWF